MDKYTNLFIILFFNVVSSIAQRDYAANVEIVRDSFGVPHIFGKTDADVAYGLGWATCEDDFETLQWGLLVSKHMLARWKGREGAIIDYVGQLLRVREFVDKHYREISPEVREYIEAAVKAINRYAELHPEEVIEKKAFPATGKDVVACYMLSNCLLSGIDKPLRSIIDGKQPVADMKDAGHGSNTFAANSKFTKDGNVYLNINSHQPLEGPMSWYEVHLVSEEGLNILGGTFHGGVTVFHGVNEHLGWAHTVNDVRLVDVFQLQMHPKKKNCYLVDGKEYRLQTDKATMYVNISKKGKFIIPVKKKIWYSIYGPTLVTKRGVFALRLGALQTCKTIEQYYRMNKAKSFTEWRGALDTMAAALMTFAYADRYDTIYCLSNGLIPKRAKGYDWANTVPGNTEKTLWKEFYSIKDLPQVLNPSCGYIFNVNNGPFEVTCPEENPNPENFDPNMGFANSKNNRSRRFYEMIKKYDKIDWNDFLTLKYDNYFPSKGVSLPFRKLTLDDFFEMNENDYPDIATLISEMKKWNRSTDENDSIASVFLKAFWNLFEELANSEVEKKCMEDRKFRHDVYARNIVKAKDDLIKHFGTTKVPYGQIFVHERGGIEMPVSGGPDQWRAKYPQPYKNGKFRAWIGESYICLVKFTKEGPEIYTVSPYGASNKPGSKHYTDQMKLYTTRQTKKMPLDKTYWYQHAESIYRPK
ncbi:MAG: penicillin acylase family protein [Chitinophagales bacterium]|nr:penicillin acylase family protein [Chitinophagales bacterium]MDW8274448.1 penicillin acylase family protein [Chitinophagales bacterium]